MKFVLVNDERHKDASGMKKNSKKSVPKRNFDQVENHLGSMSNISTSSSFSSCSASQSPLSLDSSPNPTRSPLNQNEMPTRKYNKRKSFSNEDLGDESMSAKENINNNSEFEDSLQLNEHQVRKDSTSNDVNQTSFNASRLDNSISSGELDQSSMTKAKIESCKGDLDLNEIECFLETDDLWKKFYELGTEMIITKSGR